METEKLLKTLLEEAEFYEEEASDHGTAIACRAAIAAVEALRERVETARLEVEQCHAKSTCCCGDYMKQHTGYDGHSPVAMYDYALDGAVTRAEAAEALVVELAGALERIVKGNHRCPTPMALLAWAKDEARTVLAATPAEAVK